MNIFNSNEGIMTQKKVLSVFDLARELHSGRATIKFLLRRFKNHLPPSEFREGQPCYSSDVIHQLIFIQDLLETGMLPSDIDKELQTAGGMSGTRTGDSGILPDTDSIPALQSLVADISMQQQRIAAAHEKQAQAEERKAVAEEKKADAMNRIAAALQKMSQLRISDPEAGQIASDAADAVAEDVGETAPADLDDLSLLIDVPQVPEETQAPEPVQTDLDDLSLLVDEPGPSKPDQDEPDLDDLTLLIDTQQAAAGTPGSDETDLDDLTLLIDDTAPPQEPESGSDIFEISIDASPEDGLEAYKAAVMKTVIGLKEKGMSVEQATQALNQNRIKTLSGKPEWGQKAISQIYTLIDAAR